MRMYSPRHVCQFIAVMALAAVIAGCGWHLRGSGTVELTIKQIAVTNQSHDGVLYQQLLIKLRRAGVEVVNAAIVSDAPVLTLYRVTQTRRTMTIVDGKAQEYELLYRLEYDVQQGKQTLLARQTTEATRVYSYDASEVLAKEREQDRLYRETRSDVINTVLRQLRNIEAQAQ